MPGMQPAQVADVQTGCECLRNPARHLALTGGKSLWRQANEGKLAETPARHSFLIGSLDLYPASRLQNGAIAELAQAEIARHSRWQPAR
jgi:hypothetical protein